MVQPDGGSVFSLSSLVLHNIAQGIFETIVEQAPLAIEELMNELERYAQEGPHFFPEDMITDQPERQICAELIREKLLLCLDKEIPHGTAVEITGFTERDNGMIDIEATIFCEKESHKGIIIGKRGAMLKKIGALAREDMEAFLGARVNLQTWVKIADSWRDSLARLRNFGYTE